ncbi:MAG: AAA family ATPase, partial [Clostridiales bacterium]|nr:AAA family ATPase [Clostridiales bacterium]
MMDGLFLSLAFADIMRNVWNYVSSGYAVLVYAVLIIVLVVVLVVILMLSDGKTSDTTVVTIGKPESNSATPTKSKEKKEEVEEGNRFPTLTSIDAESRKYVRAEYDENITLKELCESFRNFAAYKQKLYYDISDIRRFIAGLAVSHITILQGMSGTGKTSLAYAFGEFLDNPSTVIPVQPMWKERTDLLGYYNEFTKRFNETQLLQVMYKANYSKDIYITVLDEMNIARVEYYFAEFLSMLEIPDPNKRYLGVVTDKWANDPKQFKDGNIKLPDNMWFIGTANNDDSTFAISDKVYDRAMVMNLDNKAEPFTAPRVKRLHLTAERFKELTDAAQREYKMTKRNARRLDELDKYMIENFRTTFGNRIMKQIKTYIPVYVGCGGEELDALDDILAKKVLRKLEMQNPVYIKNAAEGFLMYLDELFGADKMPQCKAVMDRLCK